MKRNVQKALAISGLAIVIGASGLSLPASVSANTTKHAERSSIHRTVKTRKAERINKSVRRIIPGVVSSVSDTTIKLTSGSKSYTVATDSSTRFLNRKWQNTKLSEIKTGDKIRVQGSISDLTITAKTVRDISL